MGVPKLARWSPQWEPLSEPGPACHQPCIPDGIVIGGFFLGPVIGGPGGAAPGGSTALLLLSGLPPPLELLVGGGGREPRRPTQTPQASFMLFEWALLFPSASLCTQ